MGTKFVNSFRCITTKRLVISAVAAIALAVMAAPSFAQTCLQNEYNLVNKQKLNCTANDVSIAAVTNIRDPQTGATLTSCVAGATFNFIADFEIKTTSAQARENIGLYISTNSQTQALTGSCVDNIVSPQHPCHTGSAITCGSDNYHETDTAPDNCGDTSKADNGAFGPGTEKVTLEIDNFLCEAPAGSNQVQLPNCTSWQIPGGTIQCVSPAPDYPYPFNGPGGTPTAVPGSPSKCNCGIIPLGITVQTPGVNVGKACNTNATTTSPTFSVVGTQLTGSPNNCSITPEGGTATYTVEIRNDQSNFGSVVVDQVCDSAYGQIFPASGTCNAGSQCIAPNNVTGTGCSTGTTCTAATIALNGTYDCTFTANQPENITVTNIASAIVHGSSSGTQASGSSGSVSVTSHEASTTATVTKGVNATTAACATIRYSVDVADTSAAGTDQTLALSALNDSSFGDVTTCQGSSNGCTSTGNANILGTTCGVASGVGTLTGTAGAGALPANVSVGGDYTCLFDAQICSGLTNGCFTHSNKVTATVAGDESESVTVTTNPNPLNVKVCVATTITP
jgi:hypothetical protein